MKLTDHVAERIARRMRMDGFDQCSAQDVRDLVSRGSLKHEDAALESRILQELEEYGVEV